MAFVNPIQTLLLCSIRVLLIRRTQEEAGAQGHKHLENQASYMAGYLFFDVLALNEYAECNIRSNKHLICVNEWHNVSLFFIK